MAALFHASSFLGNADNIEAVANVNANLANRLILVRTIPVPIASTLVASVTNINTYTPGVSDIQAFSDAGLEEAAEVAAVDAFAAALSTALSA